MITKIRRAVRRTKVQLLRKGCKAAYAVYGGLNPNNKTYFKTTIYKNISRFGNRFLETFPRQVFTAPNGRSYTIDRDLGQHESRESITISVTKVQRPRELAWARIGFKRGVVIVEAMQTEKAGTKYLNEFRRIAKKQALDKILEEIEAHAKQMGYRELRVRRPETLFYYQRPLERTGRTGRQTRAGMRLLYDKIAANNQYKKGLFFYVKKL
ncbi:MAG: hypothetical protein Q7R47_00725 [Candidatus Diapherotrites archaeon]|nr:hypothetical protein [Candidatus Diapherotrites archaeon]